MNTKKLFAVIINERPVSFLSIISGLKDFVLGLAFLLGADEVRSTKLYNNFDELIPGHAGWMVGIMFILVGGFVALSALIKPNRITASGLRIQALAWLFCGIMYCINGEWVFAIVMGLFFSVMNGYLSFFYRHRLAIYKKT